MEKVKAFCKRKNIEISVKRYLIDALGAMAQGLFASLLIGTIISTLGTQLNIPILVTVGTYAKAAVGPAMAIAIGYALQAAPLVLFSLAAVGAASNELGGAGGPLAVLVVAIFAAEFGKAVSKETKIDIIVTPFVTIFVGVALSIWWAPAIGAAASAVGNAIMWATELQPFFMGIIVSVRSEERICDRRDCTDTADQQRSNLCSTWTDRISRWCSTCRMLCADGRICSGKFP